MKKYIAGTHFKHLCEVFLLSISTIYMYVLKTYIVGLEEMFLKSSLNV